MTESAGITVPGSPAKVGWCNCWNWVTGEAVSFAVSSRQHRPHDSQLVSEVAEALVLFGLTDDPCVSDEGDLAGAW